MQIQIHPATHADIVPWIELSEAVAGLFGPMPDFSATLAPKIDRKQALCARIVDGPPFAGGILLGGSADAFWIRWLAVTPAYRRCGIGRRLIEAAIACACPNCVIYVDTFTEETAGGLAARRAYQSCGFAPSEVWENEGIVRQRFMKTPAKISVP
ncbi:MULTISPECIES: GNAT family N-acetyltransferase [unclassified Rhizobium]|mgnify:CR=1 FL=1|jgi:GNAT superfamily N-acetyltransferase|uniref:GNAT family N-acetyltransferase n=1 Tax=unclassified Rhizobium TaxID=2613769 RepID=UPI000B1D7EA0|nr:MULTISPECIES: GNAT family N-acetyltransferase [unclassified Rhizobium]MBN8949320.1 GNAT family N-acetyltransferase [Rhizobium tropici]RKD70894.1 ribosomal protein S18 acetylase RimI-like enzyme [Rhizobium sp. WW_1]